MTDIFKSGRFKNLRQLRVGAVRRQGYLRFLAKESLEDRNMLAAAPVLMVTTQGLVESRAEVTKLAGALELNEFALTDYGAFLFADENRFGALPTMNERVDDSKNEDDARVIAQELDLEAIAKIVAPEQGIAIRNFQAALGATGTHPNDLLFRGNELFELGFSGHHSTFAAFNAEGEELIGEKPIDTRVTAELSFNKTRILGPGAKLTATYDSEGVAQVRYAMRGLEVGNDVDILSTEEAGDACAKLQARAAESLGNADLNSLSVDVEPIYYAPDLEMTRVRMLVPHYHCTAMVMVGREEVSLLEQYIPAATSAEIVPQVSVGVESERSRILATINVEGGQAPYQIYLGAGGNPVAEGTSDGNTKVEWTYVGRMPENVTDNLVVTVVDSNGLQVTTTQEFSVQVEPEPLPGDINGDRVVDFADFLILSGNFNKNVPAGTGGDFDGNGIVEFGDFLVLSSNFGRREFGAAADVQPVAGGIRDYGIEIPAMEFGNVAQSFANRMSADGVVKRFFWTGNSAWEDDFHSPSDSNWIDNTDITLYTGHGNSNAFTFSDTSHSDGSIDTNDAEVSSSGDWGDGDLEWLALYSCQVLRLTPDTQSLIRWTQEFDGLHILLGFHTNAGANMNFTGEFADNMLRSPFLWWNDPMKVRVAWFDAVDSHQSSGRRAVAMGPIRNDGVSNVNDYFWGKGSVGPDIRDNITGFWVHTFTS